MARWWIAFASAVLVLNGCASSGGPVKQPPKPDIVVSEYKVGVHDQLAVNVWKSPELSINVTVRPDGKISVPLLGDVVAAKRSTEQLGTAISSGLEKYIRNPEVTVIVTNPHSGQYMQRVRVTGAVENPMSVNHAQGMTVLDLVLEAGGLTEFAVGNKAKLHRDYGDKVEVFPIYLDDILNKGRLDSNYELAPSDVVTIPEKMF